MLQCIHSNDQQSRAVHSCLSGSASTARSRAQFPKPCQLAETRECAEKLCRTIAQRNCPKGPTMPRPPLSNRTSWNGSQYNQDAVVKIWLGAESNRRHVDFQSTFPTMQTLSKIVFA